MMCAVVVIIIIIIIVMPDAKRRVGGLTTLQRQKTNKTAAPTTPVVRYPAPSEGVLRTRGFSVVSQHSSTMGLFKALGLTSKKKAEQSAPQAAAEGPIR